ncbi:MAG: hypothetical protein Q9170_007471 [Blastenia crenularia]
MATPAVRKGVIKPRIQRRFLMLLFPVLSTFIVRFHVESFYLIKLNLLLVNSVIHNGNVNSGKSGQQEPRIRLLIQSRRSIPSPSKEICCRVPSPVTCMDARINPPEAFGIALGDAHVIRNAGGSAREALRSLVISEQLLGTKEILLIKHTGCGMLTFGNADAHSVVEKQLGGEAKKELEGLDFLPFGDLEQGVRDDVQFLKASKAIPGEVAISGWVYEVETGKYTIQNDTIIEYSANGNPTSAGTYAR